jgi:hypothetical protein
MIVKQLRVSAVNARSALFAAIAVVFSNALGTSTGPVDAFSQSDSLVQPYVIKLIA